MAKHLGLSGSAFLSVALITLLLAYAIFLRGFMPIKQPVTHFATVEDLPKEPANETSTVRENNIAPTARFNKLVIMLIDALRADFIFTHKTHLPFTDSLMKTRRTARFTAQAHPPTVTLPRIKALTTGSIPGFVDVVLNFGSAALQDDNLLSQFLRMNRSLIFYGDDTWIRLFPNHFIRSDGTTSFFVADYTEVDQNVTHHLDWELSQSDWDVMILHYLGLDHIGHLAGPKSPLVKPKLEEMDSVVEKIYQALSVQPDCHFLLLLCGDHGMSDQGSHGGASLHETTVPLLFISSDNISKRALDLHNLSLVNQIDIVPTLALLFGLPIPANSYGILISDMFQSWPVRTRVNAHFINSHQLLRLLEQNSANIFKESGYVLHHLSLEAHMRWLQSQDTSDLLFELGGERIIRQYCEAMAHMSNKLASSVTQYDMYAILTGILCLYMVFICVLIYGIRQTNDALSVQLSSLSVAVAVVLVALATFGHMTVCTSSYRSDVICDYSMWSVILSVFVLMLLGCSTIFWLTTSMVDAMINLSSPLPHGPLCLGHVLFGCTLLHTLSLLSSSFIEEEHQTWYFFAVTLHLLMLVQFLKKALLSWTKHSNNSQNVDDKMMYEAFDQSRISHDEETEVSMLTEVRRVRNRSLGIMPYYHNLWITLNHLKQRMTGIRQCKSYDKETLLHKQVEQSHQHRQFFTYKEINDAGNSHTVKTNKSSSIYLSSALSAFAVLLLCRVLRTWNQTGNKWLDTPDVGDWLVRPENKFILSCMVIVSMIVMLVVRSLHHQHHMASMMFLFGLLCVYCFRAVNGSLLLIGVGQEISIGAFQANIVYVIILIMVLHAVLSLRSTAKYKTKKHHSQTQSMYRPNVSAALEQLSTAWILLMSLLLRPHNIIVVAMVTVQEHIVSLSVSMLDLATWKLTLCYLWMAMATFFYQGNSNSITTVDISAGFIGMRSYNPVLTGILLCASTYAGIILWLLSLIKAVISKVDLSVRIHGEAAKTFQHRVSLFVKEVVYTLTLTRVLSLAVFTPLTVVQRYHLFVWTVFSPKLLYEGMLTIVIALFSVLLIIAFR